MIITSKKKRDQFKDTEVPEITSTNKPEESVFEPKKEEDLTIIESKKSVGPTNQSTDTSQMPEIQDMSKNTEDKKLVKKGLVLSLLATFLVGGALAGGIFYSRKAVSNQDIRSQAVERPTPTSTPTSTPTPTPEKIDLGDYQLQILNGSGIAGEAGSVNELLQTEGFKEAETDNADSYNYKKTEVQLKENTPKKVFDTIKETLKGKYDVTLGDALSEDSEFDVIVIVGERV